MAWHIIVDFADQAKDRKEGHTEIASLPVAIETVLREFGLGDEHTGSIQITVNETENIFVW